MAKVTTGKVGNALGLMAIIALPLLLGYAIYLSRRKPEDEQ